MQASYRIVGFLGKMCQQCAKCRNPMEKTAILGEIGASFLKYEDYFAVALERETIALKLEYNQFQKFFEEASEECFSCKGDECRIFKLAMVLIGKISCKTQDDSNESGPKAIIRLPLK